MLLAFVFDEDKRQRYIISCHIDPGRGKHMFAENNVIKSYYYLKDGDTVRHGKLTIKVPATISQIHCPDNCKIYLPLVKHFGGLTEHFKFKE